MLRVPQLADDVVRLRAFREEDVPGIVRSCSDPLTQRYTRVPFPYDEADARARVISGPGRRLAGEALDLAVADMGDDRLLGCVGLLVDRHDADRAEIGYWVVPAERRRGVAVRALGLLSRWAVTEGGYARLDLQAALTNTASIRAAQRCGFVREATLRAAWYRGTREDMALFSLLPGDLAGVWEG